MQVELKLAKQTEAAEILTLQKIAFRDMLQRYQDYDTSPANQTLEQMQQRCSQKDRKYYFIDVNDIHVGVLSVTDRKGGSLKRLSPIFVLPQFRVMDMLRKQFARLKRSMANRVGNWIPFYRKRSLPIFMKKWDTRKPEKHGWSIRV